MKEQEDTVLLAAVLLKTWRCAELQALKKILSRLNLLHQWQACLLN